MAKTITLHGEPGGLSNNDLLKVLKLSEGIYRSTNAVDLLHLIRQKVVELIPCHDTSILIVDQDNQEYYDVTGSESLSAERNGDRHLHRHRFENVPLKGSSVEMILRKLEGCQEPLIMEWQTGGIRSEQSFFSGEQDQNYEERMVTILRSEGSILGLFCLRSLEIGEFNIKQFPLFSAIARQVAIAVNNILAHEELSKKEQEKATLLSLSEAIAKIKDKYELWKIMIEKVRPLIGFRESVSTIYSPDYSQYCYYLFSGTWSSEHISQDLKKHFNVFLPMKETSDEWVFLQGDVCTLTMEEKENIAHANPAVITILREAGIDFSLYVKLKIGGQVIGVQHFHFADQKHVTAEVISLAKSITDIIASALANILANEELQRKADEITALNKQLKAQNAYLIDEVEQAYNFDEMIGKNAQVTDIYKNIALVAKTDSTVLILGETGTGKELVARAIHNNSPRKNKPLIKLNCAALPSALIESELFGHERGAFTGALDKRIGKFELASGSTLFLDEIGELPLELQAKLLRALQEKEVERLGSNRIIKVDVRIIAATNRNLSKEVEAGKFRQDLYYRLHIFPVTLPPLRERKEDIPLLAAHFIKKYAKKTGKPVQGFSSRALKEMSAYSWPGNIRELEHAIERAVIISEHRLIQSLHLPERQTQVQYHTADDLIIKPWVQQERDYILQVLKYTGGNVTGKGGAAELLQLPPTTLQAKMNKLGIKRKHAIVEDVTIKPLRKS